MGHVVCLSCWTVYTVHAIWWVSHIWLDELKQFLRNEKHFNSVMQEKLNIKLNYNPDDYRFLLPIFKDQLFLKTFVKLIEDIIGLSCDNVLKYLVVGDFLFSFLSITPKGGDSIIFSVSKEDFFSKIRFRASINILLEYDYFMYIQLHQKLLLALRHNNLLKKITLRFKDGESWSTMVRYRLVAGFVNSFSHPLIFSNYPYELSSIGGSSCYLTSFRNIWKAKRKKIEMDDFELTYDSTSKISRTPIMISDRYYEICGDLLRREEMSLLSGTGCDNSDSYLKLVTDLVSSNAKYLRRRTDNDIDDLKNTELIDNYQKVLYMRILNKLIKDWNILGKSIYLPHFMDNRGREYAWGMLSYTFCRNLRILYSFASKRHLVNLYESTFFKRMIKYRHLLSVFDLELDDTKSYFLIVLLYEIGKNFVKKGSIFIGVEDTINSGIENYMNKNNLEELDIEDALYVKKLMVNIYDLLEDNSLFDEELIIYKDATASGLQNYGVILGYRIDRLMYLNLDGEDWCDTYMYLINKYLNTDNTRLFNRKYWKGTIMTIPYNSVWYSCWIKFLMIIEKDGMVYKDMCDSDKNSLKRTHKDFYNSMKKMIKYEFYENKKNAEILFKYKKHTVVNISEYKINYGGLRDKYTSKLLMWEYDEKKSISALEANNMHYLDSKLVKSVREGFEVLAIHDCFGVRLNELHLMMDYVNKYYSEKIGVSTYSVNVLR